MNKCEWPLTGDEIKEIRCARMYFKEMKKARKRDAAHKGIVDRCFCIMELWASEAAKYELSSPINVELNKLFDLLQDYDNRRYLETFGKAIKGDRIK